MSGRLKLFKNAKSVSVLLFLCFSDLFRIIVIRTGPGFNTHRTPTFPFHVTCGIAFPPLRLAWSVY